MEERSGARQALFLATVGFAIAFAVWGLLSGLAPSLKQKYGLSATQASLMVAIPVLLGSLGRIPAGLLADRLGARKVMGALLLLSCLPAFALAFLSGYEAFLALGFFLGIGGTVFSVGVAYVSPWFSREQQGTALGVFGLGTGGQSIAVFLGPVLARQFGMQAPFLLFGTLSLIWGVVMLKFAADPKHRKPPLSLSDALRPLRQPLCWLLCLFYFVTFGGFVALGIYLPSLLKEVFRLDAADAGLRAAGFVVLATALRPIGGMLSDRVGASQVLVVAFGSLSLLALGMMSDSIVLFTVAALGIAVSLGLGNGAVFKLVPERFPQSVGAVTGLVGAAGGLGGFFPPLVLGVLKDRMGSYAPGFVALAMVAVLCLALNWSVFQKRPAALKAPVA